MIVNASTATIDAPVSAPLADEHAVRRSRFRRWITAPTVVLAVPAVLLTAAAVLRFVFGRASIDLVIFDQGLWAASRGLKPLSSVAGETLLEDHFGPGIFFFAVVYRIVASPIWVIVGQGIAAWAAVRIIGRRLAPSLGELRSAAVGAALLISPPVAYALLFDVHSVVFAVPFALAAIFAVEDGRPRRALLLGVLAALFRVEVGLAVAVALAVWPGPRRDRLRPAVLLAGYLAVAFHFEKALGHDSYWPIHYGYLGTTVGEALAHPLRIVAALCSAGSIGKAFPWLASGAFLAFRSPRRMVPALLVALPVLLSQWGGTGSVIFHYGYAPTLLLAPAWLPAVTSRPARSRHVIAGCVLLAVLLGPVVPAMSTGDPLGSFAGRYFQPQSEPRCIASGIPGGSGVSARPSITFLTHRERLYLWPYPFAGAPSNILPAEHLSHGDPELAAAVDYLVIPKADAGQVPAGFILEGESPNYLRYRREAMTSASSFRSCG